MLSATTCVVLSPTLTSLFFRAMSRSSALDDALGPDADAPGGDDQLAVLVAVLGDALAEDELAGALAFLLPRLAGLDGAREHVAGPDVAVGREGLLRVPPPPPPPPPA